MPKTIFKYQIGLGKEVRVREESMGCEEKNTVKLFQHNHTVLEFQFMSSAFHVISEKEG